MGQLALRSAKNVAKLILAGFTVGAEATRERREGGSHETGLWRVVACALVAVPFAVLAPSAGAADRDDERYTLSSPDRTIVLEFELDESGTPLYRVSHEGEPLIGDSELGLQFLNAPALDGDFDVRRVQRDGEDSVWRPVWGEYEAIRNRYRGADGRSARADRPATLAAARLPVFDDGVAFRYVLPRQRAIDEFAITEETTEFRFADDFTAWWIPHSSVPGAGTSTSGAARRSARWRQRQRRSPSTQATPATRRCMRRT